MTKLPERTLVKTPDDHLILRDDLEGRLWRDQFQGRDKLVYLIRSDINPQLLVVEQPIMLRNKRDHGTWPVLVQTGGAHEADIDCLQLREIRFKMMRHRSNMHRGRSYPRGIIRPG